MRHYLSLLIFFCCSVATLAASRSVNEAQEEAKRFLGSGSGVVRQTTAKGSVRLEYTLQKPDKEEAAAYLFQIGDDGGFVLVSADDQTTTILAYARAGKFESKKIPANMQTWLEHYAEEVAWASDHSLIRNTNKKSTTKKNGAPIDPLLGDIAWNQDAPFWNMCPLDSDGKRSYSGCVATAATQIMRYWKHPEQGNGSHAYTWTRSNKTATTLSANFGQTTYDWDNMLPNYNYGYNSTQANAVATLTYHMGVAIDMKYSSNGSGTQTELAGQALFKYFDYDKSMEALRPDYCGFPYFEERMLDELQAGRPVLMSGSTKYNEGHAFVCDGFDGQFFHINWGWGGYANAFFALSALDPEEQGMGGASSGEGFHVRILGIMGIKPNEGGSVKSSELGTNGIILNANSTVSGSKSFSITMNQIFSEGIIGYEGGKIGFGVYDESDDLVAFHSLFNLDAIPAGYYYNSSFLFDGSLVGVQDDGHYRIVPVFKDATTDGYKKMLVNQSSQQDIPFVKIGNIIYFNEEDVPPTEEYPVTKLQVHAEGNAINCKFDCDAPYYHIKLYNSNELRIDEYVDFRTVLISNVPTGTWTLWICGTDANQNDTGIPVTVEVTVDGMDLNVYDLMTSAIEHTIHISYESNAPYFQVRVFNDNTTITSTITKSKKIQVKNVPDGVWTVWVRPVCEAIEHYVGTEVTMDVEVPGHRKGDLDDDNKITMHDMALLIHLANRIKDNATLTSTETYMLDYADLDEDGNVSSSDIEVMQNLLLEE